MGIHEVLNAGELNNAVKLSFDVLSPHSQYGALKEYILPPGEIAMETGGDFNQSSDSPTDLHVTTVGAENPVQDLEKGRFSGPIWANDANSLPLSNLEANVAQRPKIPSFQLATRRATPNESLRQHRHEISEAVVDFPLVEPLPDAVDDYSRLRHDQAYSA